MSSASLQVPAPRSGPWGPLLAALACALVLGARAVPGDELLVAPGIELEPRSTGIGERVPELVFTGLDGQPVSLASAAGEQGLVIAARRYDSAVADRNGPLLAGLERAYAPRGVGFLYVHVGAAPGSGDPESAGPAEILAREELEAFGFEAPYVLDEEGRLGRELGLETGAVVYLLDGAGTLQYRGALDDAYRSSAGAGGASPGAVGREFLREALESLLERRPVMLPATRAPGAPLAIERVERPIPAEVTYHDQVARILQATCVECHHEGGAAPFPLTDYETAFDRRRMIGMVVESGIMPPWSAAEPHGTWKGDRHLTARERGTIAAWVAAGAPEGDPALAPIEVDWTDGWLIGEPDVVFQLAAVQEIPAEGVIPYLRILADKTVDRDMWIEGMQVRPTDQSVVHHASAFFLEPREVRRDSLVETMVPWLPLLKGRKYEPMQLLWGYAPGRPAGSFEPGVARFLPKGSQIFFEMHYTTNGRATTDRTRLGLVLAERPADLVAETHALSYTAIDLAPGGQARYTMEYEFEYPARLRSLVPHMHYRGSHFTAQLLYPDGSERQLIEIPEWDFDWQHTYVFHDGPLVEPGMRVRMQGSFDNSAANLDNPDPTQRVEYGVQTWEEMLKLGVEWIRPREAAAADKHGARVTVGQ